MADNVQDRVAKDDDDDGLDLGLFKIKNPAPGAGAALKQGAADARDSALKLALRNGPAGDDSVADSLNKPDHDKSEYMSPDELKAFGQTPPPRQAQNFAPTPSGQPATDAAGPPTDDDQREKIRQAIKNVESSGGNYGAVNDGAYGAYQFRPKYWNELSQKITGHDVQELVPAKGDTPEVQQQKKADQDKLFNAYYKEELVPWVKAMRKDGLGEQYSDTQLAGLFHFRGAQEGEDFLEGKVGDSDKGGTTIKNYLARIDTGARGGSGGDRTKLADLPSGAKLGGPSDKPDLMKYLSQEPTMDLSAFQTDQGREAAKALKVAAGEGEESFNSQLAKINNEYRAEKDSIAKREIAHTLADAFTKLGAGLTGMKTGVDMSHVQTPQHDFTKDYELNQHERSTSLEDLKARREEQQRTLQHGDEMAFQRAAKGAELQQGNRRIAVDIARAIQQGDHEKVQEAFQQSELAYKKAFLAFDENKQDQNTQRELQKAWQDKVSITAGKLSAAFNSKEYENNPKNASAGMEAELASLGVPRDEAHAALFKAGVLWGQNAQNPEIAAQKISEALEKVAHKPWQDQSVKLTNPKTGQSGTVPKSQVQAFLDKNGGAGWQQQPM